MQECGSIEYDKEGKYSLSESLRSLHDGYLPIEGYGVIGNLHTTALVGMDGSIDFMCWPEFDSPSVFGRLLDKDKGGHFSITASEPASCKQQYMPFSNVLVTKFLCENGVGHVTDYMHRLRPQSRSHGYMLPWVVRTIEVIRGALDFDIECFPAFDYARAHHSTRLEVDSQEYARNPPKRFASVQESIFQSLFKHWDLSTSEASSHVGTERVVFEPEQADEAQWPELENDDDRFAQNVLQSMDLRYVAATTDGACPKLSWTVEAHANGLGQGVKTNVHLTEGQRITLILRPLPADSVRAASRLGKLTDEETAVLMRKLDPPLSSPFLDDILEDTLVYWLTWIRQCKYTGRWLEHVERSALTLKLLTYEPTGAVVAASTFSLPEAIGDSGRNWDYRFTWIRDSAFTMYAFMRLGLVHEAKSYMQFIIQLCQQKNADGGLQIMYTLRGGREMHELILPHLEGYRGCSPVRIGNGAADHLQLDIYGELMDAVYLYNKYSNPLSYDQWREVRMLVDYVCAHYAQPDMGIWEVRGMKQNFTYSKVMCWVAIDRGLRLVDKRDFPCASRDRWRRTRDGIYEEIMANAWNPELKMFSQSYEHHDMLDAAVLAMPLVFFCDATDPRFLSTLKRVMLPPDRGGLTANNLVFRYNATETDDGLSGEEGAFSLCTFWLAEALARASPANRTMLYKAQVIIEEMIMYGNHLGLFSEEIDKSGKHLGNFPQAFTHIALISSAFNVNRELENGKHVR